MHKDDIPLVGEKTPMSDTLLTISQRFGVVGVLDDNGYRGNRDRRRLASKYGWIVGPDCGEVMTRAPERSAPHPAAEEAVT
jgi:arabinose-5-phosphate isomerase